MRWPSELCNERAKSSVAHPDESLFHQRVFGRTWGADERGLRKERSDTRIRGRYGEELVLASDAPIARVRYVLLFERVLAQRGEHVTLVSSDAIAEGFAE